MALGGENIGQAYIRILADGSGMNRSIRDSLKENDKAFEGEGAKAGAAYSRGFSRHVSGPGSREMDEALDDAFERSGAIDKFIQSRKWQDFRRKLAFRFGEAGDVAGQRFEKDLVEGMDFDGLQKRLGNLTSEVAASVRSIHTQELRDIEEAYRFNAEFDRKRAALHRASLARLREEFALLRRESGQLLSGDENALDRGTLLNMVAHIRAGMSNLNIQNSVWNETLRDTEHNLRRVHPQMDRLIRNLDLTSDRIGTAFGRGSRNDFLNFIGSFIRGTTMLATTALPRLIRGIQNYGVSLGEASRDGRLFSKLLGDVGKVIGGLGGVAVGAIGILGPVIAIFSQLAGVVTALASSIGFALVGALGALPAVILPAVAGIATIALAAFHAADNLDDLRAKIKPLRESFSDLAEATGQAVFSNVEEQASRLAGVLDGLQPMFRAMGNAISNVGDSFLDALEGPGFERWSDSFTKFLPDAIESFGRITENVIGGLGGLFEGMIPFMRDVLGWLERITGQFSDWSNSAEGQTEIIDFFERTKTSLRDVGDFLGSVRDLFNELVSAGQGAGDSLFASMSDSIDGWVRTIRANPDILGDWFDSAESFGRVLGDVITGFGKVFDALDNEFSRGASQFVFEGIATALDTIAGALRVVSHLLGVGESAFMGFAGQAAAAALVLPRLTGGFERVKTSVSGFVGNVRGAETRMSALAGAARNAAGIGGMLALVSASQQSNKGMSVLLNTLGGAATGFALGGPIGALIGGGLGGLLGIANAAGRASDAAGEMQDRWAGLKGTLDEVTGATTAATRAYVYDELARQGILGTLEAEGVARRTVINAMLGQPRASREVNAALQEEILQAGVLRQKLSDLKTERQELALAEGGPAGPTEAGQARIRELDSQIASTERAITKQEDLVHTIKNGTEALRNDVGQMRDRAQALQDLSALAGKIPKRIISKIEATGVVPTTRGIAKVADQYNLVDGKQIRSLIEATGVDTTVKDVKKVLDDLNNLDRQRPKPKTDVDNSDLNAGTRDAESELNRLARIRAVASVDVDTSSARSGISSVESWLDSIQDELVYVNVERRYRGVQENASGGIVYNPTMVTPWDLAGEAGAEAIVPLNRPLGEVDPAVRWLSAIAQGKIMPGGTPAGRTVDVGGLTVVTPTEDPYAVAKEVVNAIVGSTL